MIHRCGCHLSACQCPEILDSLRSLATSDHVYVGNVIESRIRDGLNTADEFDGVDIHHPLNQPRMRGEVSRG